MDEVEDKTVRFLCKLPLTQTWKEDLKIEIVEILKGVRCKGFPKEEWERRKANNREEVPYFALIRENKGF